MNCRDVWLPHLVFVCYNSSHCTSCCSVCDQLLFGSGHLSDNQRREKCSALLRQLGVGDVMGPVIGIVCLYSAIELLCPYMSSVLADYQALFLSTVDCLERCCMGA